MLLIGFGAHGRPERTEKRPWTGSLPAGAANSGGRLASNVVSLVAKTPGKDVGVSAKPMISFLASACPRPATATRPNGRHVQGVPAMACAGCARQTAYTAAEFGAVLAASAKAGIGQAKAVRLLRGANCERVRIKREHDEAEEAVSCR
jgi:hypothetical protein